MKQILVFVLFAAMLCWLMFSPIYKHVVIVRQAVLQQEVNYLLEIGASGGRGYISTQMQQQSRERLARFGMRPEAVRFEVSTTDGMSAMDASRPVPRGTGILLTMSYPYENLFEIDRLIGLEPVRADERMSAFGIKMSEYMP